MARKSSWSLSTVLISLAAAIICIVQLAGCGSGGEPSAQTNTGTLKMSLSDKPSDDFQKLIISIKEVRVVPAGYESSPDNDAALPIVATYSSPLQVDVLTLKFLLQSLGQVNIPAGGYTQIRLILADNVEGSEPANYLVLQSDSAGTKIPIKTPSGNTSGLKVNCQLNVQAGNQVEVVVDFDPSSSIVATGNGKYIFKPTGIRVVEVKNLPPAFGYITGFLMSYAFWETAEVKVVPSSGGSPVATSYVTSTYSSDSDDFQSQLSSYVPSGTYRVHVSSPGFMPYSSPKTTVNAGALSSIGSVQMYPARR